MDEKKEQDFGPEKKKPEAIPPKPPSETVWPKGEPMDQGSPPDRSSLSKSNPRAPLTDDEVVQRERQQTFTGRYRIIPQMLRGRYSLFDDIADNKIPYRDIFRMVFVSVLSLALYGLFMGTYNPDFLLWQPFVAAVKLPMIFMISLAVCLPALFITSVYLGMNVFFRQILALFMVAISVTAITAACLAPMCLFFQIIIGGTGRYHWLLLINVMLLAISGLTGLVFLSQGIGFLVRRKAAELGREIRAKVVLRVWMVVYVTVTVMLTWQLRPYLCRETLEWAAFRPRGQHFLQAVTMNAGKLAGWIQSDQDELKQRYRENAEETKEWRRRLRNQQMRQLDLVGDTIPSAEKDIEGLRFALAADPDNPSLPLKVRNAEQHLKELQRERKEIEALIQDLVSGIQQREEGRAYIAAEYKKRFEKAIEQPTVSTMRE